MQYRKICFDAKEVVKEAASYVRDCHEHREELTIEEKGKQNFVTQVDKKAEEQKEVIAYLCNQAGVTYSEALVAARA